MQVLHPVPGFKMSESFTPIEMISSYLEILISHLLHQQEMQMKTH